MVAVHSRCSHLNACSIFMMGTLLLMFIENGETNSILFSSLVKETFYQIKNLEIINSTQIVKPTLL